MECEPSYEGLKFAGTTHAATAVEHPTILPIPNRRSLVLDKGTPPTLLSRLDVGLFSAIEGALRSF